jgi:peptidyl-dipeptidase A
MALRPHRLVATLQERLARLETAFHQAYWESQVRADPVSERRRNEVELELRRAIGDPDAFASVCAALDEGLHDPLLRRQLEVLRSFMTANQMSDEQRAHLVELSGSIEGDFASYRPTIDGRTLTENDIEALLKASDDVGERRRAWEASKEVGGVVAGRVRELARVRNHVARELGYADHYSMALELQEIPEDWLFEILGAFEELTSGPFRRWKAELDERLRARFREEALMPWHYADPFFQLVPPDGRTSLDALLGDSDAIALTRRTFALWEIDLADVLDRSDLYPRPNKCQHAFCLDVDGSGRDVRILANVVPGERWMEIMLHESGHAAYDLGIDCALPYLVHRPAHTFVTEAIAILCGRLVHDPEWLSSVAALRVRDVIAIERDVRRSALARALVFARWGLVMVHFERELYADPEGDLDARWWDLVERFQLLTRPPDRAAPDWAAKIHVAAAPVYYHNYLLGEMLTSQLRAACERDAGGLAGVTHAGRLLQERVFTPGAVLRWDALVESATGSLLSADAFAANVQELDL